MNNELQCQPSSIVHGSGTADINVDQGHCSTDPSDTAGVQYMCYVNNELSSLTLLFAKFSHFHSKMRQVFFEYIWFVWLRNELL